LDPSGNIINGGYHTFDELPGSGNIVVPSDEKY
jgi:hypothetical protein